jgi:Oligosaccharide biosynthesis protein Alg14 like
MLSIVNVLEKDKFAPRSYVAALTDNMSLQKAEVYEESLLNSKVSCSSDNLIECLTDLDHYQWKLSGKVQFMNWIIFVITIYFQFSDNFSINRPELLDLCCIDVLTHHPFLIFLFLG